MNVNEGLHTPAHLDVRWVANLGHIQASSKRWDCTHLQGNQGWHLAITVSQTENRVEIYSSNIPWFVWGASPAFFDTVLSLGGSSTKQHGLLCVRVAPSMVCKATEIPTSPAFSKARRKSLIFITFGLIWLILEWFFLIHLNYVRLC